MPFRVQGEGMAPSCPQGADSASPGPCARLCRESWGEEQVPAPACGSIAPSLAGVLALPGTHCGSWASPRVGWGTGAVPPCGDHREEKQFSLWHPSLSGPGICCGGCQELKCS